MSDFYEWLKRFCPQSVTGTWDDRVRAAVGAGVGILATGLLAWYWSQQIGLSAIFLIAPMGASSVILFCLPSSPLAQPWSILAGNTVAAFFGVFFNLQFAGEPALAAALSMMFSVIVMFALRCLHPPSGAVALTAILGGPATHHLGYEFVLWPVLGNSVLLVMMAIFYNNLTGRQYPAPLHNPKESEPEHMHYQFGFKQEDLDAAMKQMHEVIDISQSDLQKLVERTELIAYKRKIGEITCEQVMSKVESTLTFGDSLEDAWKLLRQQPYPAIPVVNAANRVIGLLSHEDFMRHANADSFASLPPKFKQLIMRTYKTHNIKPEVVGQIMTSPAVTISQHAHIIHMVPLITTHHLHVIPVVDDEGRLIGVLSQTDVIRALYQ